MSTQDLKRKTTGPNEEESFVKEAFLGGGDRPLIGRQAQKGEGGRKEEGSK